MLLIKLLLSSSSFLLLFSLLLLYSHLSYERISFGLFVNYLHFFGAGRILRIRQRQHSPDSLRLIYFARYLCNFFITIFIIYYCQPLIGYVLIFCFFFELKFKLKFVRRFFWRRNGIGDGFRSWLGGLLRAGNGATGARDELQTATVGSH